MSDRQGHDICRVVVVCCMSCGRCHMRPSTVKFVSKNVTKVVNNERCETLGRQINIFERTVMDYDVSRNGMMAAAQFVMGRFWVYTRRWSK